MSKPPSGPLRPLGFVNKKILDSAGDLGVPRVVKKASTVTKEFALSSARAKTTSARKTVEVADELTRPVYSSFGRVTPRGAPPKPVYKPPASAKPAAQKKAEVKKEAPTAPPVKATVVESAPDSTEVVPEPTTVADAVTDEEVDVPAAPEPTEEKDEVAEGMLITESVPVTTESITESVPATTEREATAALVEAAVVPADEVPSAEEGAPCTKRRVWSKDALPDYLVEGAADDEDDADDGDFEPEEDDDEEDEEDEDEEETAAPDESATTAEVSPAVERTAEAAVEMVRGVSQRRSWAKDLLPSYLVDAELDDDDDDADYMPGAEEELVVKALKEDGQTTYQWSAPLPAPTAQAGPPPTIAHASMAMYTEYHQMVYELS